MQALRPARADDSRPFFDDPRVAASAVQHNAAAFIAWADKFAPDDYSDKELIAMVTEAWVSGLGDPKRVHRLLTGAYGLPHDEHLFEHLLAVKKMLPVCHRIVVLEWMLRNRIRFPAKVGETIAFVADNETYHARVHKIDADHAVGFVEFDGNPKYAVYAEHVTYNITRSCVIPVMVEGSR